MRIVTNEIHRSRSSGYWPFFWAPLLSVFIGAVAYFVIFAFVPGWNCNFEMDNGRGAILRQISPRESQSGVRVELDSPSGFPPQRRCRAYVEEESGGHKVLAEADYPSKALVIAAMLVTLLPILGVVLWGGVNYRRRRVK